MKLSIIFASSSRQNILRELSKNKKLYIMELVSKIGSTYNETRRNLKLLEAEEIIILVRYERRCIVYLIENNAKTKALLAAQKILDDYDLAHKQKI